MPSRGHALSQVAAALYGIQEKKKRETKSTRKTFPELQVPCSPCWDSEPGATCDEPDEAKTVHVIPMWCNEFSNYTCATVGLIYSFLAIPRFSRGTCNDDGPHNDHHHLIRSYI